LTADTSEKEFAAKFPACAKFPSDVSSRRHCTEADESNEVKREESSGERPKGADYKFDRDALACPQKIGRHQQRNC
jgi:hypothetical protein